jgi:hypothetical protein
MAIDDLEDSVITADAAVEKQKEVTSALAGITEWVTKHSVSLHASGINSDRAERVSVVFNQLSGHSAELAELISEAMVELGGLRETD